MKKDKKTERGCYKIHYKLKIGKKVTGVKTTIFIIRASKKVPKGKEKNLPLVQNWMTPEV